MRSSAAFADPDFPVNFCDATLEYMYNGFRDWELMSNLTWIRMGLQAIGCIIGDDGLIGENRHLMDIILPVILKNLHAPPAGRL